MATKKPTKKPTKKRSNVEPPNPVPYDYDYEENRKEKLRGYRKYEGRTTGSRHGMGANKYTTINNKPYRFRMPFGQYEYAGFYEETKKSTGQKKDTYNKNVKNPSRAQPKGTAPRTATPRTPTALPPRSGASSGGSSSMYNRLTGGGLPKHGR